MKNIFLIQVLLTLSLSAFSQIPTFQWAHSIGAGLDEYGYGVATDISGNVYVAGKFYGTVDFDPGPSTVTISSYGSADIFICKFDAVGTFIWARTIGSAQGDAATAIAVDGAGNVYTTGQFTGTADFDPGSGTFNISAFGFGDTFVSKLDASGNFVWAKQLGGTYVSVAFDISLDATGNVYTTGYFNGTADFDPGSGTASLISAGSRDIFISKLTSAGNYVWAKQLGGLNQENGYSVAVDPSGNVYSTGIFQGTADFDPGSGTVSMTTSSTIDYDVYVSKLNASGNFVWAKQMGNTGIDYSYGIALDASSNVYTAGAFSGTVDFDPGSGVTNLISAGGSDIFVSKLDASGNFSFAKRMGGIGGEVASGLWVDGAGNNYTTGSFGSISDFDPGSGVVNLSPVGGSAIDAYVSKLDASGNYVWVRQLGGTIDQIGQAICVEPSGSIYTTGYYWGTCDFNPDTAAAAVYNLTANSGNPDFYIHKMSEPSTVGMAEFTDDGSVVYPNPFSSHATIVFNEVQKKVLIQLFDAFGRALRTAEMSGKEYVLEKEDLVPGIYFLRMTTGDEKVVIKKLIIVR